MRFVILLLLVACSNDAITFMHTLDPKARCKALVTSVWARNSHYDTAMCQSGSELLLCTFDTDGYAKPTCEKVRDVMVENK